MKLGNPEASNSTKVGKGIYLKKYSIANVEDYSNVPNKPIKTIGQKGFQPEICLKLYLLAEGMEKPFEMYLFGKYKKDKVTGEILNWDAFNNHVQFFLYNMFGEFEINNDFSIPQRLLLLLNGKQVQALSYVKDYDVNEKKLRYQTYSKLFNINTSIEDIMAQWNKDLPYNRKYNPKAVDIYEEDNTNFNSEEFEHLNDSELI